MKPGREMRAFSLPAAIGWMALCALFSAALYMSLRRQDQLRGAEALDREARQAALLGLEQAMAEMQPLLGPDARSTAEARAMGLGSGAGAPGRGQWLGVWSAGGEHLGWLVSGAAAPGAQGPTPANWSGGGARVLGPLFESAGALETVEAPWVPAPAPMPYRWAWWVEDLSLRAPLDAAPRSPEHPASLEFPGEAAVEVALPDWPRGSPLSARLIEPSAVAVLPGRTRPEGCATPGDLRQLRFDLGTGSLGLLTNSKEGGCRLDFSRGLAAPGLDETTRTAWSQALRTRAQARAGAPTPEDWVEPGPSHAPLLTECVLAVGFSAVSPGGPGVPGSGLGYPRDLSVSVLCALEWCNPGDAALAASDPLNPSAPAAFRLRVTLAGLPVLQGTSPGTFRLRTLGAGGGQAFTVDLNRCGPIAGTDPESPSRPAWVAETGPLTLEPGEVIWCGQDGSGRLQPRHLPADTKPWNCTQPGAVQQPLSSGPGQPNERFTVYGPGRATTYRVYVDALLPGPGGGERAVRLLRREVSLESGSWVSHTDAPNAWHSPLWVNLAHRLSETWPGSDPREQSPQPGSAPYLPANGAYALTAYAGLAGSGPQRGVGQWCGASRLLLYSVPRQPPLSLHPAQQAHRPGWAEGCLGAPAGSAGAEEAAPWLDRAFCSGLETDVSSVAAGLASGPHPRLCLTSGYTSEVLAAWLAREESAACAWLASGRFNINSAAPAAWAAMLGATPLQSAAAWRRESPGAWVPTPAPDPPPSVARRPANYGLGSCDIDGGPGASPWQIGARDWPPWVPQSAQVMVPWSAQHRARLLLRLAERVIRQHPGATRGTPYLGLADFAGHGALEGALNAPDLQPTAAELDSPVPSPRPTSGGVNQYWDGAAWQPLPDGVPARIRQADWLLPASALLSSRGDSFLVRVAAAYTPPTSATAAPPLRLEARVQRVMEYVDEADSPETPPEALRSALNRRLGRRLRVVSLRWIGPNDP